MMGLLTLRSTGPPASCFCLRQVIFSVLQDAKMTESKRMAQLGSPPNDSEVAAWIGEPAFECWKKAISLIDRKYPDVFVPEWLYGSKEHGWSLRYKKNKSFCTLMPEKDNFAILIVFGKAERQKVEAIKDDLLAQPKEEYEKALTYHDGKWVFLPTASDAVLRDLDLLLGVKKSPKMKRLHNRIAGGFPHPPHQV